MHTSESVQLELAPWLSPVPEGDVAAIAAVLDEAVAAFSAKDPVRMARTNHYPHVRIAGDVVQVWDTEEEYARANETVRRPAFGAERALQGWAYTRFDWRCLAQYSTKQAHVVLTFSRLDAQDRQLATFDSLRILTRVHERWGIKARSSFAGRMTSGAY